MSTMISQNISNYDALFTAMQEMGFTLAADTAAELEASLEEGDNSFSNGVTEVTIARDATSHDDWLMNPELFTISPQTVKLFAAASAPRPQIR